MTALIAEWAPNIHPLVVHFPIVLLIAAVAVDALNALIERPALGVAAAALQTAGVLAALAAYFSGVQASATVHVPGMAHGIVDQHRTWALVTVWYFSILTVIRVVAGRVGILRTRTSRLALLVLGMIGVAVLTQAGDLGGELVYRYGVGVIEAPPQP